MDELLTFAVGINTSAAEAGLASLGGSADGVAAGLEDRFAGASEGMQNLGKSSAGASRGIQGLASVISLVDPRLGQVVRSVGTLTRGLTIFRLGMGAAIPVVAAVTGALYLYQRQQAEVAEQERRDKAISDAMVEARRRLKDATSDLDEEIKGLTDSEKTLNETRQQLFVESLPAVQEFTRQIAEQSVKVDSARMALDGQTKSTRKLASMLERGAVNQQMFNESVKDLQRDALSLTAAERGMSDLQSQYMEFLQTIRDTIGARKQQLQVSDQRKQAIRTERQDLARLRAEERERATVIKELADIERDALLSTMTEHQRLNFILDERLQRLTEIQQQSQGALDTSKAETALRIQHEQQIGEIRAQEHQKRMREIEAEERRARQAALDRLQVGTDLANSLAGLATKSFGDSQAAQVAQARLAQFLAVANAIARDPTPLGALRGAVAAANIEAQIQGMRGVTAHRGALYGDEYMVKARSGEAHLSNQGRQMIGDDNIRRANRGQSPRGVNVTVRQMYEHRGFNRFADDNLKIGGPMRAAIRSSSSTLTGFDVN